MATTSKKKKVTKEATKEKVINKKTVKKKSVGTKKITPKKAEKKTTTKVAKSSKSASSLIDITPKERWKMVAVAAYHKAEKRGFAPGNDLQDWIDAEKEISALLNE